MTGDLNEQENHVNKAMQLICNHLPNVLSHTLEHWIDMRLGYEILLFVDVLCFENTK